MPGSKKIRYQRLIRFAAFLLPLVPLAGCVSEGTANAPAASATAAAVVTESAEAAQPRRATYRCENGSTLTIENLRTSVVVIDENGDSIDLPASPAESRARYGSGAYALVLEENEALWMRAGKEPDTCLR